MVIRNEAGEHISKKDLARLKQLAEDKFMAQLDKGEELIQIEGWSHTSLYASVHVGDAASAMAMVCEGKKLKLKLVKKAEFEASRKSFVILTGLVTGPAAKPSEPVPSQNTVASGSRPGSEKRNTPQVSSA